MIRILRRSSISLVTVAVLALAPLVRAEAPEASRAEAAERFDRAIRRVNSGDLTGALSELERANALVPSSSRVLYNLGLVYSALNRPVEAARILERALDGAASLNPDNVERARQVLREQKEKIGLLEVSTNVREGTIEIDNISVAKLPIAAPLEVASGLHVVGVVANGFAPARQEVTIAGQQRAAVRLDLVPIEGLLAHVAVQSRIPAAHVLVDGQRIGKTPLESTITVAPGAHTVEIRRPGYAPASRSITIQDGARADLALEPTIDQAALEAEGGWLEITASEKQPVATVDGAELGLLRGPLHLPAGPHRLRVESGGFMPAERDVEVLRTSTRTIYVVFQPTPETRSRYVASATSRRTWSWITMGVSTAVAAGGLTFALVEQGKLPGAENKLASVGDDWVPGAGRVCDPMRDRPLSDCISRLNQATDDVNNLKTGRAVGWIAAGVGGAGIVAGVILLLTGDDPHKYDDKPIVPILAGVRVEPWVRLSGVSVVGQF